MIKLNLHLETTKTKLGRPFDRRERLLIDATMGAVNAYNGLERQRRATKDEGTRLALRAAQNEIERFIDVSIEEINVHFSKALDKRASARRARKAA